MRWYPIGSCLKPPTLVSNVSSHAARDSRRSIQIGAGAIKPNGFSFHPVRPVCQRWSCTRCRAWQELLKGGDRTSVLWSTFYDIRRYGGLQIFLRALLGGGSLVLSSAQESTGDFLIRAGAQGVTHISGTPSHWRRALMSPSAHRIAPRYVRLSGEIADQAILDDLRALYPEAKIAHAFASTEAGVAFEVGDGLAGFPASLIGQPSAQCRNEGRRWLAAYPLSAKCDPLSRQRERDPRR